MEDASLVSEAPAERRISSTVELREALGSDVVAHFPIDAPPPVTEEAIELAADVGQEAVERVQETVEASRSNFMARLNPRTRATQGEPIELVVDTHRLHFFDPDTGLGIYGKDE
jgi:multiple sugar transport system ATP-binding protein